jgi:tryptophanyl-tRNA synthetase
MNEYVRVSVNSRVDFFNKYYVVPQQLVPEVQSFVAEINALGERCADCTEFEARFASSDYATLKNSVGECVVEYFKPVRAEYNRLIADKTYLDEVMKQGAEKASYLANKTLSKVYRKVGLVR